MCLPAASLTAFAQSQLSATPGAVSLSGTVLNVQVAVAGSGPFAILPSGSFFTVSETSDTAPAVFTVSVANTTCSNGNLICMGSITLHPTSPSTGSDVAIPVSFTPGPGAGGTFITASPASVSFNAFPGQSVAATVMLTTTSVTPVSFTVTQTPQNSWLTVSFSTMQASAAGTSPGSVTMTAFANTTGLIASQGGSVTITASGGAQTVIPVTLNLAGSTGATYSASPSSVALVYPGNPQSQHIDVFSSNASVTAFNAAIVNCTGANFLLLSGGGSATGTVLVGQPVSGGLNLSLNNPSALPNGAYECQVVLSNPASVSDQLAIPVSLTVGSPASCAQPLCVNRTDDSASNPLSGMLRYAVLNAPKGATITFDPALNGQTIALDSGSPNNHIKVTQDLTIQGPGPLTISGGNATRIFFIGGGNVAISGVTLANGLAKGGDGGTGGGGAGMGGAIFLNAGFLTLSNVVFSGNRAQGGNGGAASGGGGGGFGGNAMGDNGANGGDLGGAGGIASGQAGIDGGAGGPGAGGGSGGGGSQAAGNGGNGGFGGGGGLAGSGCGAFGALLEGNGGSGGFGGGGGVGRTSTGGFGGGAGTVITGTCTTAVPLAGGGGGAGFGGAIFAASGSLLAVNTTFLSNLAISGMGGGILSKNGQAKGAALFICSSSFCGPGYNASVTLSGVSLFEGSSAASAGASQPCPGRDDPDVCGALASATPTHFLVTAPSTFAQGQTLSFTVTALDANNNTVIAYSGPVHFSSTDTRAALPPNAALTRGTGTFTATLNSLGSQSITVADAATSSIAGTSGAIAIVTGISLSPVSASPGAGSGSFQIFTFTFNDPNGYQDLDVVNILFNTFLDGRQACYLAYSRTLNTLYLVDDTGSFLLPNNQLNNSQCSVNLGANPIAQGSGNTLTVTLSLGFSPGFAGNKVIYLAARSTTQNSGWQALGTWTVPGATATSPAVGAVNPARGSGPSQSFTFTFTDHNGTQDLGVVDILINNFLDGRQACYVAYSVPLDTLYLVDDTGSSLLPGLTLGGSGTLSNSQCTISSASAASAGTTLFLTVNLAFTPSFAGNRIVYMAARNSTDTSNSGWQPAGTWSVTSQ